MTKDEELLRDDMLRSAQCAVYENLRHSEESLFMLLAKWFPEASEEMLDEVVGIVI